MSENGEIEIRDFSFPCIIGELPHERQEPQPLVFCIRYQYDFMQCAKTDDILNAVNYVDLCDKLKEICLDKKFRLLETLTVHCAYYLLDCFPALQKVDILASKPEAFPGTTLSSARFCKSRK